MSFDKITAHRSMVAGLIFVKWVYGIRSYKFNFMTEHISKSYRSQCSLYFGTPWFVMNHFYYVGSFWVGREDQWPRSHRDKFRPGVRIWSIAEVKRVVTSYSKAELDSWVLLKWLSREDTQAKGEPSILKSLNFRLVQIKGNLYCSHPWIWSS